MPGSGCLWCCEEAVLETKRGGTRRVWGRNGITKNRKSEYSRGVIDGVARLQSFLFLTGRNCEGRRSELVKVREGPLLWLRGVLQNFGSFGPFTGRIAGLPHRLIDWPMAGSECRPLTHMQGEGDLIILSPPAHIPVTFARLSSRPHSCL